MICIWSSWCHCRLVISCFIKIQNDLTFLVPAYPGCPGNESVKWLSICLSVCLYCLQNLLLHSYCSRDITCAEFHCCIQNHGSYSGGFFQRRITVVILIMETLLLLTFHGNRRQEGLVACKKIWGDGGGRHWLVQMEWCPAGWSVCLPLLIFPCTIKSRSSLLPPAHPGGPEKRAVQWLWCGGNR